MMRISVTISAAALKANMEDLEGFRVDLIEAVKLILSR